MTTPLRSFCLAVALLAAGGPVFGQEAEPKRRSFRLNHQLGLNVTNLATRFLRSGSDTTGAGPVLFSYRVSNRRIGLRLGLGGNHRYSEQSEEGFRDSETNQRSALDVRLGVDYQARLGKRFSGHFGLEAVRQWSLDKQVIDSGFDVIRRTTQTEAWGGGPAIGLYFWINRHLGLFTEANFYMLFGETESARNFENFPELNDHLLQERTEEFTAQLPTSVFLIYRF